MECRQRVSINASPQREVELNGELTLIPEPIVTGIWTELLMAANPTLHRLTIPLSHQAPDFEKEKRDPAST